VCRGLKGLFPPKHNPYYASFGTRPGDMVAFSRCGVPEGRIFLVNPETGGIRGGIVNRTFRTTYEQMNGLVHEMFPAVADEQARKPAPRGPATATATATATGQLPGGASRPTSPLSAAGRPPATHAAEPFPAPDPPSAQLPALAPAPAPAAPHDAATVVTAHSSASGATGSTAAGKAGGGATAVAEDTYNDFNFWRIPIRSIDTETGL